MKVNYGLLYSNIRANCAQKGFERDLLVDDLYEYVVQHQHNEPFEFDIATRYYDEDLKWIARQAIFNGVYTVYDENSNLADIYEVIDETANNSLPLNENSLDDLYTWAANKIHTDGKLLYAEANEILGQNRATIYAQLVSDKVAMLIEGGLAEYDPSAPVQIDGTTRVCSVCGQSKPASDYPSGRAMCRSCYNASRRKSMDNINGALDKFTNKLSILQEDLLKEIRSYYEK